MKQSESLFVTWGTETEISHYSSKNPYFIWNAGRVDLIITVKNN